MTKNPFHRGQTNSGVAIILCPSILRDCNMTGKPRPITSTINYKFTGRMIGATLCFLKRPNNSFDKYHKRGRGKIKIFLDWIYHPVENDDQKRFNEELASFYNAILWNAELLAVQDVNSNIGV